MSHPRALTDPQALAELERWYADYERVGTFDAKARELGITRHTLRDTIRRLRNQDTRAMQRKLGSLSRVEIDELADLILSEAP